MEQTITYLSMVKKVINLRQNILRLQQLHHVQEIFQDWSAENMKKSGLNEHVYDFSVNYDAIAVDDILDIHNHLMKKNDPV